MSIGELARTLDEASDEGRVAPLDAPDSGELDPDRVRVLRSRLYMLGYIDADNGRGEWDGALDIACRAFDREAALPRADARASWDALDELVCVERPLRIREWLDNPDRMPALRRAAHLRLFCLGFAPLGPRPRDTGDELARGLGAFVQLLGLLDPSDPVIADFSAPLLERLFDHDGWIERFAASGDTIGIRQPANASRAETLANRERVRTFVLAVARIELWLQGYSALPRPRVPADAQGLSETVRRAMLDFWADQPEELRPGKSDRADVDGGFFRRLAALRREAERAGNRDAEMFALLETDADLQRQVRDEVRSLGARIWDGVRRAARWIHALFDRVAKTVRQVARNIARVLYGGAARALGLLRNSMCAVIEAARFVTPGTMQGSDPAHLVVRHDADFDLLLLVNASGNRTTSMAIATRLSLQARLAAVGVRIVGHVAELLTDALRGVTIGWLALMLVLYRAADELIAWARDADLAGELLASRDAH